MIAARPAGFSARVASVLGIADFRYLWLASTAYFAARWVDMVTTGWLALDLTGSSVFLALVAACRFVPMLVLGLLGGSLAARFPRRTLLAIAVGANLAILAALTAFVASGVVQPWHLIVSTLLINAIWALFFPIQRSFVGETVGGGSLTVAFAVDQFGFVGANLIFSALAGGLIPVGGPQLAHAVGLAGLAASLAMVLRIHRQPSAGDAPVGGPGTSSFRTILAVPVLGGIILISILMNGLAFPIMQLMPLVARDVLNVGPAQLGLLLSAHGGGSLAGSLILFALAPRRGGLLFAIGTIGGAICLLAFTFAQIYPLALAIIFLAGVLLALFGTYQSSLVAETPDVLQRTRALGMLTVAIGFQPVGLITAGYLAEATSPALAFRILIGLALASVITTFLAIPGLARHRGSAR